MIKSMFEHLQAKDRAKTPLLSRQRSKSPLPRRLSPLPSVDNNPRISISPAPSSSINISLDSPAGFSLNIPFDYAGRPSSSRKSARRLLSTSHDSNTAAGVVNLWKRKVPTDSRLKPLALKRQLSRHRQRSPLPHGRGLGGPVTPGGQLGTHDFAGVVGNYLQNTRGIRSRLQSRRAQERKGADEPENKVPPLEKFKKAAHMIILLLRACRDNSRDQRRNESRFMSFTQYQDEISNQTNRVFYGTELTFDPKQFKAHTEIQLSPEAKAILEMDPRDRTEEQRHLALVGLQQTVSAFSEFPITMQRALVNVGWYEQFESKRVIIRQGHTADNFYMIISGTAVVTKLETDPRSGESFAHTVAMLGKGNSFGELALMHGATRSATVTSKNSMELLALGRDDFIDIFMHIEKDKEPEHIRYLRALDIIKGWPIDKLPWDNPKICLFTYFRRGVVMCRDNNTTEWIYVIKTGSCRVLKTLTAVKPNIPGLHKHTYTEDLKVPVTNQKGVMPSMRSSAFSDSASNSTADSRMATQLALLVMDPKQPFTVAKAGTLLSLTRSPNILPPITSPSQVQIREVDEENLDDDEDNTDKTNHLNNLEKIFKEKHPPGGRPSRFGSNQDTDEKVHTMYVQIQRLGPKDTFGLDGIAFSIMGKCPKVSMVSEGSEAILINKKFFMSHLTDEVQKRIRISLQPYPSDESLQQRFQDQVNWDAFKTLCIKDHVIYNKYMNDTLNE